MGLDPRTPVIVGVGQVNQRDDATDIEPVDLMAAAAREAADPRVLQAVDAIRVVNLLSWRYRDPGLLLGARIGAPMPRPSTPVSAATPRSHWSIRPAWTSRLVDPTSCCWPVARPGGPGCG